METVNIKVLAKALNLSISTVSRALRDSYDISEQTKQRVREMAALMNYQPNPHASSLRHQKSKTIAVVIPEIDNNFFTLAINGIESIAREKGYHVLIYLTHEDYAKEESFLKHLHNGRVDGVLISLSGTTKDYSHLTDLQKRNIPLVLFDRVYEPLNTNKVTTDDVESGYLATEHLIQRGCTRIAYLMISKELSIGTNRRKGYIKALINYNIPVDESLVLCCSNDNKKNVTALVELLSTPNRPDGLFASVERLAINSYEACREMALEIPKDIKVIGFSNLQIADFLDPSLSTIAQPAFQMGEKAASLLFIAIEKKTQLVDETFVIKSMLHARRSTN